MKNGLITSKSGMTLVEIMMAIVVLGIMIGGSSSFVGRSYSQMEKAKRLLCAQGLAENVLERLMNSTFRQIEYSGAFNFDEDTSVRLTSDKKNWEIVGSGSPYELRTVNGVDYHIYLTLTKRIGIKSSAIVEDYYYYDVHADVKWPADESSSLSGGIYTMRAYE